MEGTRGWECNGKGKGSEMVGRRGKEDGDGGFMGWKRQRRKVDIRYFKSINGDSLLMSYH